MSKEKQQIPLTTSETIIKEVSTFGKAQVSAFFGGVVDFGVMVFLTEIFGVYYIYSIAVGGCVGAIINFLINRHWTFKTTNSKVWSQLFKFTWAVLISILSKSAGTYFLTTYLHIDYRISRLITDAFVCFVINYSVQKWWVFRR